MDKITALLTAATPFIVAFTALVVTIQHFKVAKLEKHTNGMQAEMMKLAKEKGAQEEKTAQSKGETTVG